MISDTQPPSFDFVYSVPKLRWCEIAQLEAHYNARMATKKEEEMPQLSPEIENFLKETEKRFRQG